MLDPAPVIQQYASTDDVSLATRVWSVEDPIAEVVFLHGIISHGGWYLESCSNLASHGFQVHFLERRGSGLNGSGRGDVDQPALAGWERVPSLRWIVLHMIEEYARHNGHADLLREAVDGETGE